MTAVADVLGVGAVEQHSALALAKLARGNSENQRSIAQTGAIVPLVLLLQGDCSELSAASEAAAAAAKVAALAKDAVASAEAAAAKEWVAASEVRASAEAVWVQAAEKETAAEVQAAATAGEVAAVAEMAAAKEEVAMAKVTAAAEAAAPPASSRTSLQTPRRHSSQSANRWRRRRLPARLLGRRHGRIIQLQ